MGEGAALFTAIIWAIGIFPFTEASNRMGAFTVNNFRLLLAALLLSLMLWLGFGIGISEMFSLPNKQQWFWLGLSGLIGLTIGDYFSFSSFSLLGPRLSIIFATLAPGLGTIARNPDAASLGTAEKGYLHCGPAGAGHFVKMVHNGIEYGLMAAYAEGLNVLKHADIGKHAYEKDAETTPLRHPEHYQYDFDLAAITELWRRGSVVGSWLLDLTAQAMAKDPSLAKFGGRVSDSGEGRWTLAAANDEGVPAPVLAAALFGRFSSRGNAEFMNKVMSAQRFAFGGHLEKH